jgi:hypothetical protein
MEYLPKAGTSGACSKLQTKLNGIHTQICLSDNRNFIMAVQFDDSVIANKVQKWLQWDQV